MSEKRVELADVPYGYVHGSIILTLQEKNAIGGKQSMSHCLLISAPQHGIARISLTLFVGEQFRITKGGE